MMVGLIKAMSVLASLFIVVGCYSTAGETDYASGRRGQGKYDLIKSIVSQNPNQSNDIADVLIGKLGEPTYDSRQDPVWSTWSYKELEIELSNNPDKIKVVEYSVDIAGKIGYSKSELEVEPIFSPSDILVYWDVTDQKSQAGYWDIAGICVQCSVVKVFRGKLIPP